jgi:signal transduction histidine kinase
MTRAVLLADDRRSALATIAGRAREAVQAGVAAVLVHDADGLEVVVAPTARCAGPSPALIESLFDAARARPAIVDISSEGLGTAIVARTVASKHTCGVLVVARKLKARRFTQSDARLLAPFAAETSLILTIAAARRDLERGMLQKDRTRISRELHDGVIQSLYGIGLVVESIRKEALRPSVKDQLSGVTQTVNVVIDDLRAYINDLTPASLAKRGLGSELRSLVSEFQTSTGVIPTVRLDEHIGEIGAALGRDMVQIAREALANVAKHAKASRVSVSVDCDPHNVRLEIVDDGRGITPGQGSRGRGLENILLRAQAWGGVAEIGRYGGIGTTVRVTVPLGGKDAPGSAEGPIRPSGTLAIAG